MEELLKVALVGLAKGPVPMPGPDEWAHGLVMGLSGLPAERLLLLRAGVRAVYEAAGFESESVAELPAAAPKDTPGVCSARAAAILAEMFRPDYRAALLEALTRLAGAGRRLPPELLPRALGERDRGVRTALAPVLGERGRWLSGFREDWDWAAGRGRAATDTETVWREGTVAERRESLRQTRGVDPARARRWLAEAWSAERAENRARFLEVLDVGLAPEDETFLEQVLEDRSARVKGAAGQRLARLTGSAFARRMRERADQILTYVAAPSAGRLRAAARSLVGATAPPGSVALLLPRDLAADWARDGIQEKPPAGLGSRTYWGAQVLALVPPAHWAERFGVPPNEVARAAARGEDGLIVLGALSAAAVLHQARDWIEGLWDAWQHWTPPRATGSWRIDDTLIRLLQAMGREAREERVGRLLERPAGRILLEQALETVDRPWGVPLARAYLAGLRRQAAMPSHGGPADGWLRTVSLAAFALPVECAPEALAPWGLPETSDFQVRNWRMALEQFAQVIRLRKEFAEQVS